MGQTPKNLKQKFFSVLGTSSEYKKQLISGISNKVCVASVLTGGLFIKLSIYLRYIIPRFSRSRGNLKSIIIFASYVCWLVLSACLNI